MGQPLSPEVIARIRELKGRANAVEVSALLNCSPETVRRLWRGETHRPALSSMDPTQWLRQAYPEVRGPLEPSATPSTPPANSEEESASLLAALKLLTPPAQ